VLLCNIGLLKDDGGLVSQFRWSLFEKCW